MLIDIHCHNDPQNTIIHVQQEHQMASTLSSTSNEEYESNAGQVNVNQKLSYGVHPWRAQTVAINEELLNTADLVGEIGLDTTWTDVPLAIQRPVFERQLKFAANHHKPVVLHVKGCERELLQAIRKVPEIPKLIHWYSSKTLLDQYMTIPRTWFSVGPDVFNDPAVQNVARQVSLDRLFIESDGFEGISWALGQRVTGESYYQTIRRMYTTVAHWREIPVTEFERQLEQNWRRFC